MKKMTGEIGTLFLDDKQVGGFKYWTAVINPGRSHVIASQFWMLKKVETDKLKAKFYAEVDSGLKLIREEDAIVNLPDCELDKTIVSPLRIDFVDSFDWRK